MSTYIDFKKLKERVSLSDVVLHYNLPLTQQGDSLVGDCPLCGDSDSKTRRFHVSPSKGAWKCWACNKHGNILDLAAAIENVTLQKSALLIAEWFDITDCNLDRKPTSKQRQDSTSNKPTCASSESSRSPSTPVSEEDYYGVDSGLCGEEEEPVCRNNPPLTFPGLKNLDLNHPSIVEGGLVPELCEVFASGICSKGMMQSRLAVPIHNLEGELLAYCGIAMDDRADRLKFPPEDKYNRELDLFNLHRAVKSSFFEDEGLIIVEDILDAFSIHASGNDNVVASMGGALSIQQLLRLGALKNPSRQFTVIWKESSPGVRATILDLSRISWVHAGFPDSPAEIRDLALDDIHSLCS